MSKVNKILLGMVVILLAALGIILYWQKIGFKKPYWAVYLNTGDLYFGKLDRFPRLSLSDIYFLQRNPDNQQNPLSLSKFSEAFWGPEDKIYLEEKNIVWKAKLKADSQIVQFIKNYQTQIQQLPQIPQNQTQLPQDQQNQQEQPSTQPQL